MRSVEEDSYYSKNMEIFEALNWNISSSIILFFLNSETSEVHFS